MTDRKEQALQALEQLRKQVEEAYAAGLDSVDVQWDIDHCPANSRMLCVQGPRRVVTVSIELWSKG